MNITATYPELVGVEEKFLPTQIIRAKNQKALAPDRIVLTRIGDFYESFSTDALVVSKNLELVLTSKLIGQNRLPMTGVPYHALSRYSNALTESGFKLAIVEADGDVSLLDPASTTNTILLTPATTIAQEPTDVWLSPEEAVVALDLKISPNTLKVYPNRSNARISTEERFAALSLEFSRDRWRQGLHYLRIQNRTADFPMPPERCTFVEASSYADSVVDGQRPTRTPILDDTKGAVEDCEPRTDSVIREEMTLFKPLTPLPTSIREDKTPTTSIEAVQLELPLFDHGYELGKNIAQNGSSDIKTVLLIEEWQTSGYGIPAYQRCQIVKATEHRVRVLTELGDVKPIGLRRAIIIPSDEQWDKWVELASKHQKLIKEFKSRVADLTRYDLALDEELKSGKKKKQIPNPLTEWVIIAEPSTSHKTNFFAWHIPYAQKQYAIKHSEKMVALGHPDKPGVRILGRNPLSETFLIKDISEWEALKEIREKCIQSRLAIGHFVDVELNHKELTGYSLFNS